ncbi:MAG: hypothetical protein JWR86_236 [Enterovirga sp.]|nr:hypothetical protein [Enterovirga sp.]
MHAMTRIRLPVLFAALVLAAGPAHAQGFFERLFGITPDRPAPSAPPAPAAPADTPAEGPPRYVPPPVQARPVALRVPVEDAVIGRELKKNGSGGSLRIERTGRSDLRARLTLAGRKSAASVESCTITLGDASGVALTPEGRPDGLQRYAVEDAATTTCPLQIEVLDEAVLIKPKSGSCLVQTPSCQADAAGLWGPEPSQLIPRARDYEAARGVADKAVRDNYKALVQRARPEAVRPLVSEQASFSSDREVLCRTYAKEAAHSFCNARYSEGRAISLAQRLGVTVASNLASPPAPTATEYRVRRRADPYSLPATDEIVQSSPLDE